MAGIIAALTDNGQGIAGVGYAGVKVMPVTVLGSDGTGSDSDIIEGVVYAVDHGADVINMSFSNPGFSSALQVAIDYAWAHNVVVVAATGNDGSTTATFPAGDRGVIGVSNTDQNDALNASSNYGADTFLAAPGTDIVTLAAGGGTTSITGTSASSAEVAAAAAVLRASDPAASNGVIVGAAGAQRGRRRHGRSDREWPAESRRAPSPTPRRDSVQPAGAAPVGAGGPFVGPYVIAAGSLSPNSSTNPTTLDGGVSTDVSAARRSARPSGRRASNANNANNLVSSIGWRIATTAAGDGHVRRHRGCSERQTLARTFNITAPARTASTTRTSVGYIG